MTTQHEQAKEIPERLARIVTLLGMTVREALPQFIKVSRDPAGPFFPPPSNLTFGSLVERKPTDYSPDLPQTAKPNTDLETGCLLMEGHLNRLAQSFYESSRRFEVAHKLARYTTEERVQPVIDGYCWYRAYHTRIDDHRGTILAVSWLLPKQQGACPFPTFYTVGEVSPEEQRSIVQDYNDHTVNPAYALL